ncbi:vascular endothelial zinc finger 1-like isoform X1 [Anguilla anguilla]|uniref:vascular endothelial zinc finger 1-like isoform X1 n=1 Tax=Anguilla anguilla TaxID=7936 RepID=UPI0015AE1E0B|nr:vascular endothelial zinc finger 1-like isoform X1 [Anguilla anguilla]
MDAAWSNFLFQTPPTQNQAETALQSDLLPELTGSAENPPTEHIAPPPSTVDTAALNEEPVPVKPVSRPARAAHICPLCNKQFKNSYNLRRHQSVHTGIRMKDRAAREREEGVKEGRAERQTVPLSLLHLSVPPPLPPPQESVPHPPSLGGQESQSVAVSIATATVTMAIPPPLPTAVVVAGAMVQRPANLNPNPNPVRKNHACEACGKAFRDVYHLNRHRLSHSDEKPYSCPICQQRFKRKDRMSYHVRSHQGGVEKPYVCPHCAKGFSRPDHLNSHVRQVHSTERPFKCETLEPRADLRVGVRHTGSSARPHDPARGEGALPHLRQAAVRRLHHRSHEGSQPIAAPRLPPVQSQLYHAHLPARPCSEAPQPGMEGQRGPERGFWRDGGRRGPAVPAVRGALQNSHPAARTHGHAHDPPEHPQPHQQHHHRHLGLQRQLRVPHQHGVQCRHPHQHGVQRRVPHQHGVQRRLPCQHGVQCQRVREPRGGAAGFGLLRDSPPVSQLAEGKGGTGEKWREG